MTQTMYRFVSLALMASVTTLAISACGGPKEAPAKSNATPAVKTQPAPGTAAPAKPVAKSPAAPPAVAPAKPTPVTPKPAPVAAAPKPVKEPDHILNPSFELANKKGVVENWWSDDPKAGRDSKAHAGEYAMKLHPSAKKNDIRRLRCKIEHGETLLGKTITVKAMTNAKLRPKAGAKAAGPFAMHVQYSVNGKEQEFYHLYGGGADWSEATVSGAIPKDADPKSLRLVIAVRSSAADPVLVDNVTLTVQ